MTVKKRYSVDDQMRQGMGNLLRTGVLASALVVVIGGILFFMQHPGELIDYTIFQGEPERLKQVHLIIREALELRGRPVIQLGLLMLIATPVARVIFSLTGFIREKDWTYVIITAVVLTILSISMFSNYFSF